MKVYQAKLSKAQLEKIPVDEKTLFLGLALLSNELLALEKMTYWAHNDNSSNLAIANGQLSLSLMLLRLLIGKVWEGYLLITEKYFGTKLSAEIEPFLPDEVKGNLIQLKKYFGKRTLISSVRNNIAFHYNSDELVSALPHNPEDLIFYTERGGKSNNLYYFAEIIATRSILRLLQNTDEFASFQQLFDETLKISRWLIEVSDSIISEIIRRHKEYIWEGYAEEVVFDKLPDFNEVRIPWFTDTTSAYETPKDDS